MNQYDHDRQHQPAPKRTRRITINVPDRRPDPAQMALFADDLTPHSAEEKARLETNRGRWEAYKQRNPHIAARLWELALAQADEPRRRRISVAGLFEQIRQEGDIRAGDDDNSEWGLSNDYRSPATDDLCVNPRLAALIERRARHKE